jgi:succinate dehydrogenase / fumarate reductase cytochrome b subunit
MFSGAFILAFIVFHILHFTTGTIQLGEKFEHGYVYNNMWYSFSNPLVSGLYIFAMIVMGFHLNHGVWSLFQTLGLDNPDRNQLIRFAATGLTIAIVVGFIIIPVVFMSGMMPGVADYPHEALTGH